MIVKELDHIFEELFPICRSITGEGIRESFRILSKHIPFEINSVRTGTKVFDWEVPKEWTLKRATLIDPDGNLILDTERSNLHVVNFSEPFEGELDLEELKKHLHTIPNMPTAIPYVTSYYQERWGFCMKHEDFLTLKKGKYRVSINVVKEDGYLNYGIAELKGSSKETFIISTYLCHPSMANNELSGPLAMLYLYQKLADTKGLKYTYRFVIVPETIGSITYLATEKGATKDIVGGMVLTCLGGSKDRPVSLKLSRRDWLGDPSGLDDLARHLAKMNPNDFEIRDFDPTGGSDERQYCSPGINLPVIQASKTIYGQYKEYHTSLDTKELMIIESVRLSAAKILEFINIFDSCSEMYSSAIKGGEPRLSKHDLYPTLNSPETFKQSKDNFEDGRSSLELILKVLSLVDGSLNIIEIAEKLNISVLEILPTLNILHEKGLIIKTKS